MLYVRLARGAHVLTHGERFAKFGHDGMALPPARAQVLRLKRARMERMRDASLKAVAAVGAFVEARGLLAEPFVPTFAAGQSLSLLLARLGGHFFGADADVATPLKQLDALLTAVDLTALRRRQQRHRVNDVIVPALLDVISDLAQQSRLNLQRQAPPVPELAADDDDDATPSLERPKPAPTPAPDAAPAPAPSVAPEAAPSANKARAKRENDELKSRAISPREIEDQELVLLDLLGAPPGSFLASLGDVLSRIEVVMPLPKRHAARARLPSPHPTPHLHLPPSPHPTPHPHLPTLTYPPRRSRTCWRGRATTRRST